MGDIRDIDDETPTPYAPREAGRRVYDEVGREFREQIDRGRGAVNRAGNLYNRATGGSRSQTRMSTGRSLATTGRSGSEPVRDDSGISGQHAGETVGRKRYGARAKYMEYLDDVANMRRIAQRGDRTENTIVFKKRQDKLDYLSSSADVTQYQQDNRNCDAGNRGACNRAGRGDSPTEYASPFRTSEHYNDFAYFGAGGTTRVIPAQDTSVVAPAPAPAPPPPAPEPEPEPTPAPPPPSEPIEKDAHENVDTGSSSSVLKPRHQKNHNPYSGGGSHSGSDGSASHENQGVHNFDSGGVIKPDIIALKRQARIRRDKDRQELINIQAFRNPYGEVKCDSKKRLVSHF